MVQRRGRAHFAREALERIGAAGHLLGQELHGDVAAKPDVLRLVDDAHAAAADHGEDAVVRERLPDDRQRHGRLPV
jgi:hypothetical protein